MVEEQHIAADLYSFAESQVKQVVERAPSAWSRERIEDAIHDLFLAGWADWLETRDEGLSKNRMSCRRANLLRDAAMEKKHEPRAMSLPRTGQEHPSLLDRADRRENPVEVAQVREQIARMPERQRRIVQFRLAGFTDAEIADELGISLRSVERAMSITRKEMTDDDAE